MGRSSWLPEGVGSRNYFLPKSGNEEDRKHVRGRGVVRAAERKAGELG